VANYQGLRKPKSPETDRSLLAGIPDKAFLPLSEDSGPSDASSVSDRDSYFSPDQELTQALKISNWAKDREADPLIPRVFFDSNRRGSNLRDALKLKDSLVGLPPRSVPTVIHDIASRRPEYWRIPSVRIQDRLRDWSNMELVGKPGSEVKKRRA
jgi:hypothetical protein